jgi:curved DNA-binding protein CbpA
MPYRQGEKIIAMDIEQGLFQFDLTDYHAILGVSLDADTKQIRKRYLTIARKLHPDSLRASTEAEKQKANEILSKLVNPAYEKLTQEKAITEHLVVLRLRGQQLSRQAAGLQLHSDLAKSLMGNSNATPLYANNLKKLAEEQYESLEKVLDITGAISELNLAYLVSTAGSSSGAATAAPTAQPAANNGTSQSASPSASNATAKTPPAPPSPRQQRASIIESYLNRANEFAIRRDYSRAILEMREAVKSHPNNAQCHSQLAEYYLKAGQPTMAKIHVKRALEIDAENELAQKMDKQVNQASKAKAAQNNAKSSQSKGGLFGLFGGKQK